MPPSLDIPQTATNASPYSPHDQEMNPNFQHPKKKWAMKSKTNELVIRMTKTPKEISIESCMILLGEVSLGLSALHDKIPGLERVHKQVLDILVIYY
jgi:hypothetical protein